MNVIKKIKRYNFKEHKLELYYFVDVGTLTDEESSDFIRRFSRCVGVPPNFLLPTR